MRSTAATAETAARRPLNTILSLKKYVATPAKKDATSARLGTRVPGSSGLIVQATTDNTEMPTSVTTSSRDRRRAMPMKRERYETRVTL